MWYIQYTVYKTLIKASESSCKPQLGSSSPEKSPFSVPTRRWKCRWSTARQWLELTRQLYDPEHPRNSQVIYTIYHIYLVNHHWIEATQSPFESNIPFNHHKSPSNLSHISHSITTIFHVIQIQKNHHQILFKHQISTNPAPIRT